MLHTQATTILIHPGYCAMNSSEKFVVVHWAFTQLDDLPISDEEKAGLTGTVQT